MEVTQSNIIHIIRRPETRVLASEVGRVSGSAYREEYALADGRFLQCTWDDACGDYPTAWAVTLKQQKNWIVAR